jgi:ABC-2 type transport system permease protein
MTTTAGRIADVSRIRVPERGLGHDIRAVRVVWQREMIRFSQDRLRILTALVQPVLYMFVLGAGLSSLTKHSTGNISLQTFIFPGVLALATMFIGMFSAISIVWDREFGFLREMLVAPVRRGSIMVGKCVGGATVATLQGCIVLALAPLVDVPYDPVMLLTLFGELLLLGFMITALGLLLAARIKQLQAMMGLMQMILLPLMFLSGALYPTSGLPAWLNFLVKINPVTYAVHPLRTAVFRHVGVTPLTMARLNPPITWFGWVVPIPVQLTIVFGAGLVMLAIAILEFDRAD